jgi:hypothetical protein
VLQNSIGGSNWVTQWQFVPGVDGPLASTAVAGCGIKNLPSLLTSGVGSVIETPLIDAFNFERTGGTGQTQSSGDYLLRGYNDEGYSKTKKGRGWIGERPVVSHVPWEWASHWFILTSKCGAVGYGTEGVIFGAAKNMGGYGVGDLSLVPISLTPEQEQCICDNAKAAKNGGILCGHKWRGDQDNPGNSNDVDEYQFEHQNCQSFVNCLLSKCLGAQFGTQLGGWFWK